jgi:NADH-quinone oxidoreductase subunit B
MQNSKANSSQNTNPGTLVGDHLAPGSVQVGTQAADDLSRSFAYTTKLDAIVAWGRRNALWPLPYGTACCGIELMSVMGPRYDLARFGAEVVRFSPRQSDLLIVAGTITEKMAPILVRIYRQMLEPKYVLSMGACASSGGFYRAYHVLQGADKVIPVDVYVPGCPPTPEAVLDGIMTLQKMIKDHKPRPWKENWKPPYEQV